MELPADRLKQIEERIAKAAQRSGRNPSDVTLLAVTKTLSLDQVLPFLRAGVLQVGENRVQEALNKYSDLKTLNLERPKFHLIGQLQGNKAKKAVGFFDVIQSLDRLSLAQDIDRHARELGKKQACLIEVKISPEDTKSGLPPEQLNEFLAQARNLPNMDIKGLMGIAPVTATPEESRPYFVRLRRLFEESRLAVLSLGMSSDFDIAIEEGSTMIRLGTVLFGRRLTP